MGTKIYGGFNLILLDENEKYIISKYYSTENDFVLANNKNNFGLILTNKYLFTCPAIPKHTSLFTVKGFLNSKSKCKFCGNMETLPGFNDLKTTDPVVAKRWSPNNLKDSSCYRRGSKNIVLWVCETYGHDYSQMIQNAVKGQGCSVCSGKQTLPGFNDLLSQKPHIAKEWDYTKNVGLSPEDVTIGGNKIVWWLCSSHRHSYKSPVHKRALRGDGCPYCSNHRVYPGFNDLETKYPALALEYHPTKNFISIRNISPFSNKKVWWKCEKGHEWESTAYNRSSGKGCPSCSLQRTSRIEMSLRNIMEKSFNLHEPDTKLSNFVPDILLVDRDVVIEYDGAYWHSLKGSYIRDVDKTTIFISLGYTVIRVREQTNGHRLDSLNISESSNKYFEIFFNPNYGTDQINFIKNLEKLSSEIVEIIINNVGSSIK